MKANRRFIFAILHAARAVAARHPKNEEFIVVPDETPSIQIAVIAAQLSNIAAVYIKPGTYRGQSAYLHDTRVIGGRA